MFRNILVAAASAGALSLTVAAVAQAQFGTSGEAKAMIEKAVTAVKADKAKALDAFNKGESGFKDRDLYPFCANAGDGVITAHPALKGKQMKELKDKNNFALGEEMMKVAAEGKYAEVAYMWPRPGADTTPVQKVSYVTKVSDQICGVGYYK